MKSLQEVTEEGIEKWFSRPVETDVTSLAKERKERPPRLRIHVASRCTGVGARVTAHRARRNDVAARRELQPDLFGKRCGEAPVRDRRRGMPEPVFDPPVDLAFQDAAVLVGNGQ